MASQQGNQRKAALAAGKRTRVTGVTGDQTIKATPGILWRLIFSGTGTLTLKDGATTLAVWTSGAAPIALELRLQFATSIIVTPSAGTIDCLAVYD